MTNLDGGIMNNNNSSNNNNNTSTWEGSRLDEDYSGPIQRPRHHSKHHQRINDPDSTTDESITAASCSTATHNEDEESDDGNSSSNSNKQDPVSEDLAKELYQLSMHERQRMLHDLHCVPDEIDDRPETEQKGLADLDRWIRDHYHSDEAAAYRMAEELSQVYVKSRELRMAFLRAVMDYDIERAGPRFLAFFETKLEYFGRDKLVRKLTLEDLNEEDMECLKVGFLQLLSVRDPGDRVILFFNFNALKYATSANAVSIRKKKHET
jgi:hypothetical protein